MGNVGLSLVDVRPILGAKGQNTWASVASTLTILISFVSCESPTRYRSCWFSFGGFLEQMFLLFFMSNEHTENILATISV